MCRYRFEEFFVSKIWHTIWGDGMKVIKNINNNVSLCLDSQGNEVIAFGKGIGFTKPPYEIPLEKIERTFYDMNPNYLSVIATLNEDVIDIAEEIVNYAMRTLGYKCSSNVIFTLADHIQFAIKRNENRINIQLPLLYEVKQLYPKEMEIGRYAVGLIKEKIKIELPEEESISIALHFIDINVKGNGTVMKTQKSVIESCTSIIEAEMGIQIDKSGFNYSRFATHIYYLLDRGKKSKYIVSENKMIFQSVMEEYPEVYQCAMKVQKVFEFQLNDDELLYLMLHINRLCAREDCYQ